MYISPEDFDLVLKGIKTKTSRLGDRREIWKIGSTITLQENSENYHRYLYIKITENYIKKLHEVNQLEAMKIGAYTIGDHFKDFCTAYKDEINDAQDTLISIIGFEVI